MRDKSVYFGGKTSTNPIWVAEPDWPGSDEAFLHYIGTVWVNENAVPTEAETLRRFDIRSLRPAFSKFLNEGRIIPRRGQRVDEYWLLSQLAMRSPIRCFANEACQSRDLARITRLEVTSAGAIWDETHRVLNRPSQKHFVDGHGLEPIPMLVKDNAQIAHIVVCYCIIGDLMHFADPWPKVSLLCREENDAGVAAQTSEAIENCWTITRPEFERVIYAMMFHSLGDIQRPALVEMSTSDRGGVDPDVLAKALELARQLNAAKGNAASLKGARILSRVAFACATNNVRLLKEAINRGDNLDERDTDFNTALHFAAQNGYLELVKLLVTNFADYTLKNGDDQTAAELALTRGQTNVAAYLKSLPPYGVSK